MRFTLAALALLPASALGMCAVIVCYRVFTYLQLPSTSLAHLIPHTGACLPDFKVHKSKSLLFDRVQNTSNVITWTYTPGDPSPVDIVVINAENATLNGDFSIDRFVDVSDQVRQALLLRWATY